jgi:type 1 glutamine amidotransferase
VKYVRNALLFALPALCVGSFLYLSHAEAQTAAPAAMKHILVVGQTTGFEHDSVPNAMGTIWKMGHESGLWDAYLRTDCELITKKDLKRNTKNLTFFDAIVFASTTGELAMDDDQKKDMMAFIHDEGKGFVGVHAALDTYYKWPEYGEMIGGWFDQHPWMTFQAPIILEDPNFPATRHFQKSFVKRDEIYQAMDWSRDKVNVLLRLDETKLNYENNPRIHRKDHDFAVAWSKMYGKGRVFYSTLGHTKEAWDDPDIQKMYFEAIKWSLGLTEGATTPHEKPKS